MTAAAVAAGGLVMTVAMLATAAPGLLRLAALIAGAAVLTVATRRAEA